MHQKHATRNRLAAQYLQYQPNGWGNLLKMLYKTARMRGCPTVKIWIRNRSSKGNQQQLKEGNCRPLIMTSNVTITNDFTVFKCHFGPLWLTKKLCQEAVCLNICCHNNREGLYTKLKQFVRHRPVPARDDELWAADPPL